MLTTCFSISDVCDPAADGYVRDQVRSHMMVVSPPGMFDAHGDPADFRLLNVYLRADDGRLVGALLGATYWGVLHISLLWVDESTRGRGCARELLRQAVLEALRRDCDRAWGNTWQSQGAFSLYERLGARAVWRQEYPRCGQALIWYHLDFADLPDLSNLSFG